MKATPGHLSLDEARPSGRFVDLDGGAKYLGITPRHLRRLQQERRIPYYKVAGSRIRFAYTDLDAYAESGRVEAVR